MSIRPPHARRFIQACSWFCAACASVETLSAQDLTRPSSFTALSGGGSASTTVGGAAARPAFRAASPQVYSTRNAFPEDMVQRDRPRLGEEESAPELPPEAATPETPPSAGYAPGTFPHVVPPPKEAYNFRVGPVYFRAGMGLRVEATDNLVAGTNKDGDVIITPQFYLTGHWQVTPLNDLSMRLGLGYNYYVSNSDLSGPVTAFELNPGSAIAFKMKIGDVYLRVFDRPAIERQAGDEITLRNTFFFNSFSNAAGVTAFYDFNPVRISGGYTRNDTIPFGAEDGIQGRTLGEDFSRRSTNAVFVALSYPIEDYAEVGLTASYSWFEYGGSVQNDGSSMQAGVNFSAELSRNTSISLAVGWQGYGFSGGGRSQDESEPSSIYGNASVSNRLSRFFSNTISFAHETGLGTVTNTVETTTFTDTLTYSGAPKLPISLYFFYSLAEESGGVRAADFNVYGGGISTSYMLSKKLSLSLYYEFSSRETTASANGNEDGLLNFTQNRIGLNLSYAF